MNTLPSTATMPDFVRLETPARNLEGLTATAELQRLGDLVLHQWTQTKALEDLARYGIYPIRQILFYGPPGNGKTSAAQWLGKRLDLKVYRVAADALTSAYLGKTGKNVTTLMEWLRSVGKAIVLFDEVEQLFPSREVAADNCSQELQRAMAVFWQALDRWTTPQLFVFATNMPEKLDR